MIKLIIKPSMLKVSSLLFIVSSSVFASQDITLNIHGNSAQWADAITINSNVITPSRWTIVDPLPTSVWYPGGNIGGAMTTATIFSSANNDIFSSLISIDGAQYNLGSSSPYFTVDNLSSAIKSRFSICTQSQIESNIATIWNDSNFCIGNKAYKAIGNAMTPFSFYRSLINVANLVTDIKESGVPSGVYKATINGISGAYGYETINGSLTYRQVENQNVNITINYTAAELSNIDVVGEGIITPIYDKTNSTISGSTLYYITASGIFTNGLKASFDIYHDYHLNIADGSSQAKIPYNVKCNINCNETNIVTNGEINPTLDNGSVIISGEGNLIDTVFDVNYSIVSDEIISGQYSDLFLVTFEVNL